MVKAHVGVLTENIRAGEDARGSVNGYDDCGD